MKTVNRPASTGPAKLTAFKLSGDAAEAFEQLAAKRGKTPGLLAKELALCAIAAASAPEPQDIAARVAELKRAIAKLSLSTAETAYALLLTAGKPEDEAARWVRRHWPEEGGER
jgi:hypothetical protein